jgi:ribosome biogenesis protein Nip4
MAQQTETHRLALSRKSSFSFISLVVWLDCTKEYKNVNWNNMSVNNEYAIKECLSTRVFINVDSVSGRFRPFLQATKALRENRGIVLLWF